MKLARSAKAVLIAMIAGVGLNACGGGSDSGSGTPTPSTTGTLTLDMWLNNNGTPSWDLAEIVTNSVAAGSTGTWNNSGAVNAAATDSTQISYTAPRFIPATGTYDNMSMTLTGSFSIPASSLNQSSVAGTTGTVTGIKEQYNGNTYWTVTGISANAATLTTAIAAADYAGFWHGVANGANVFNGVTTGNVIVVYCGANLSSASISIDGGAQNIKSFLLGC